MMIRKVSLYNFLYSNSYILTTPLSGILSWNECFRSTDTILCYKNIDSALKGSGENFKSLVSLA